MSGMLVDRDRQGVGDCPSRQQGTPEDPWGVAHGQPERGARIQAGSERGYLAGWITFDGVPNRNHWSARGGEEPAHASGCHLHHDRVRLSGVANKRERAQVDAASNRKQHAAFAA